MPLFEKAEYASRIGRARERMQRQGLEALLVTSPENMNYLTGYAGWSFYTPQAVILTLDAPEPVIVLRHQDVACAEYSVFMAPANIIGYPESYIGRTDRHPMEFIADVIVERGWANHRFGIEKDVHFFSVHAYEVLLRKLPETRFADATLLVDWVRVIKSDAEVALMRQAGKLAEHAMQTAVDAIAPGVRECDVAGKIYHAQISGLPEFGGGVSGSVHMPSGAKTAAPHLKWTDERYVSGQPVNIELAGCRHQYHCALSRTIHLGAPPKELTRLAAAVIDGMAAALATVKAGVRSEQVNAAWKAVINRAGYDKTSRIGYSIGLCMMPTWLERTVSLQQGDQTVLQPSMMFHMICGMWAGTHNLVMSETFRVTESGPEMMTTFPRQLFVKA